MQTSKYTCDNNVVDFQQINYLTVNCCIGPCWVQLLTMGYVLFESLIQVFVGHHLATKVIGKLRGMLMIIR